MGLTAHLLWGLASGAAALSSTAPHCQKEPFSSELPTHCPIISSVIKSTPEFWSHKPRCVAWQPQSDPSGSAPQRKTHCLFTSASFRNDQGVSIIASSEFVSDLVSLGAMNDTETLGACPPRIFAPGPIVDPGTGAPSYEVRDLSGKGKGVIALRNIKKGEVFMLDYPAVLAASDFAGETWKKTQEELLKAALSQLPLQTQNKVFDLARSLADRWFDMALGDIMATNACGLVLGGGASYLGLFPEVSRMNHACVPNAYFRFSARTLTNEVVASREIKPGDEITINYASLGMPYSVRKEHLRQKYGFTCRCSLCKAPASKQEESDSRRMRLVKARQEMQKAHKVGDLPKAIEYAEMALEELSREDGLAPLAHGFYDKLAHFHLELGHYAKSRLLADKALEEMLEFRGPDADPVKELRAFIQVIQQEERRAGLGS